MQPGDVVARRFEVERLAGAGAMGIVYRAADRQTGGAVALKVLSHGSADRFLREARVLAELAHPHIVGYVDHGHTDSREPYLAMEWLEGIDLAQRLSSGPLPLSEALELARSAAGALAAAHARGVVHRDIKPSNLFLVGGDPKAVKVLDFGAARFVQTTSVPTASGIVLGTPGYLAPEQVHDEHTVDGRADGFALACVLFESLTGRPAFVAQHVLALLGKILRDQPPRLRELLPSIPRELDELVVAMLEKKAADRPDMAAVERTLGGILDRERRRGPDLAGKLVFRWWSAEKCDHFYTTDATGERALQCGYAYEGIRFQTLREGVAGAVPLYRWYCPENGEHFYTTDASGERAPDSGYEPEGVLGHVASAEMPGTVALHRWWNRSYADHFYTTDPGGELAQPAGYEYQGVAGYVLPAEAGRSYGSETEEAEAPSATGAPVSSEEAGAEAAEAAGPAEPVDDGVARGA
jgi:hypothetical protein